MDILEIEVLRQTSKSKITLVECDGKQMVRKELAGNLPIYKALQGISHRFLPVIYHTEVQGTQTIVLEEYIEGTTLSAAQLPHKKLVVVLQELCVVLDYLHQHNIVHRDIKPSNILLAKDGHIRLIDFDAARIVKEEAEQDTRMLGTRGYAPPEQYGFSQTDQRADIYALGITMQTLFGKQVPPWIGRVIKKCTRQDADRRYQSVRRVKAALGNRVPLYLLSTIAFVLTLFVLGSLVQLNHNTPILTDAENQFIFAAEHTSLLNAEELEQITINGYDAVVEGKTAEIAVSIDGSGEQVSLLLGRDNPNGMKLLAVYDEYGQNFVYDEWVADASNYFDDTGALIDHAYVQMSACDLDNDNTKEILVSIGDKLTQTITAVYALDKTNPEMPFVFKGSVLSGARMVFSNGYLYSPIGIQGRYEIYAYKNDDLIIIKSASE